jgi:hypothetical protein
LNHEKRNHRSKQDQPEEFLRGQTPYNRMSTPRRVCVKGMEEVDATVAVAVVQDKVWVSISPPFTWEAIMEPVQDELMQVLELARDDAKKMATAQEAPKSPFDQMTPRGGGEGTCGCHGG